MTTPLLYRDRDVANLVGMSLSWVRQQRFLRKHGKDHVLDLDPVFIGSTPTYPAAALNKWVEAQMGR